MALRETEESYREMFDGNPQPMWVCQRESQRFLAVNHAALRLYGYGREEFLDRTLANLAPEDAVVAPGVGDQISSGRHKRKDGSFIDVELLWHPCEFQGAQAYLVVVREREGCRDFEREAVLEHQVAQRATQLQAAQKELETFCYSVSHDLRAPLRHIDGFSRAVLDDYGDALGEQAREYLSRISQAAGKMSTLLDALGLLARVARTELERQTVNLSVAAQVLSLELKHASPQRKVEFRIEEGVSAEADPRLARQLMEILVGNAWKFTSKNPEAVIQFGSTDIGGEKVYFVKDNGAGFDTAYAEKLFSIFHRLHRADEFEGSGVGLAVAQRIVGRHGGRIWAEAAPGQGATFFFTL